MPKVGKMIEVSPLSRHRSSRNDPQFEQPGNIFMQITPSQFFPQRFPNSFLQMMCHYKEVYLNKFNTSLINPRRAPFKRSPATSEWARYNPPHTSHLSISSRMGGRRTTRGVGKENHFMDNSFKANLYLHFYSVIKFYFIERQKG